VRRGTKVRFVVDKLGASEHGDLGHVVDDVYGIGDVGVVAFLHPHSKLAHDGWLYCEVDSKSGPARKLYVAVTAACCEVLP
jgi:hypothetical protein